MRSVGLLSPERGSYLSRDDGQKYWIIIPIITPAINISRYRLTKLWSAVITNFRWSRQRQAPETKSRMITPCQSKSPPISPPTKISRPAIMAITRCIFYFSFLPKSYFTLAFVSILFQTTRVPLVVSCCFAKNWKTPKVLHLRFTLDVSLFLPLFLLPSPA